MTIPLIENAVEVIKNARKLKVFSNFRFSGSWESIKILTILNHYFFKIHFKSFKSLKQKIIL